jgi:peptidoglycan hydrolase-like protein with peptidoglycan-binding domain
LTRLGDPYIVQDLQQIFMGGTARDIYLGVRGQDVKLIQNSLNKLGYDIPVDEASQGMFGFKTEEAVKRFQENNNLKPTGVVDKQSAAKMRNLMKRISGNKELQSRYYSPTLQPPPPSPPSPEISEAGSKFKVEGKVVDAAAQPFPGGIIRAFDVQLRAENLLGETTTDSGGYYNIGYIPSNSTEINLRVTAYDTYNKELASSPVHYCAGNNMTIDFSLDRDAYHGLSEFERLEIELIPLLRGSSLSLAQLTEDEEHDDITFLSGKTGRPALHIAFLSLAHRLRRETDISAEIWYGLLRQGLPTQLPNLLRQSPEVQRRALEIAVKDNIIPMRFGDQLDDVSARLKQLIVRKALEPQDQGHPRPVDHQASKATLGQLVSTVLPDRTKQEAFLSEYLNNEGKPISEFWKQLRSRPELCNHVEDIEFAFQAATLTSNYLPMVQELQQMRHAGEISSILDLVRFDEKDWREIILRPKGGGGYSNPNTSGIIGFPLDIPGNDDNEKAANYARVMTEMIEDTSPTAFITRRLEQVTADDYHDDVSGIPGKHDLLKFMKANPEYDFKHERLESYLVRKPEALENVSDVEGTKSRIKTMQRLYRLVPRYDKMTMLMKAGIGSANAIARMGENAFVAKYGKDLGGPGPAKAIHSRAMEVQAKAITLLADHGIASYKVPMSVLPDEAQTVVDSIPEWSALFGSLDLCKCEHCRSVLGPAAYLVDLLHFLKDRPSKIEDKYAKDILLERRPDIGEIELTCENANTPVPYVDLVNEILENAVWPFPGFSPFTLLGEQEADLNGQFVSAQLQNSFDPPLSADALISIGGQGEPWTPDEPWWTIDDLAFTYTIRKKKLDSKLHVISRSLQTKGSTLERGANPQYINTKAYEVLKENVYPWKSLPFDLWGEEARTYLGHVGVMRHQIMETFHTESDRKAILNDPIVAREHLGISTQEADLITGITKSQPHADTPGVWNLWGFEAQTLSFQNSIPDPSDSTRRITKGNWLDVLTQRVDVFLQQSGLNYQELLDLLDSVFVNPVIEVNVGGSNKRKVRTIQISSTDPNDPYTCETSKLQLTGFDGENTALKIMRFVRLWRRLGAGWTMRDLDRVITVLKPVPGGPIDDILNDTLIIQVSHIKRLSLELNLPVIGVLTFWAPIDTQSNYVDQAAPGRPKIPSLYAQLFRNKSGSETLDPAFTEDPCKLSGSPPDYVTLPQHAEAISSLLKIRTADFYLLLTALGLLLKSPDHDPSCPVDPNDPPQPVDVLNLDNLSCLYRHSILARALKLSMQDYVSLLKLVDTSPQQPFASTVDTVLLVETIERVKSSPFSIPDLDYLLLPPSNGAAFSSPSFLITPTEEAIAAVLDEIRTGLQRIVAQNIFNESSESDPSIDLTTDPNGALTRQKLALLNWDSALIEQVLTTLNCALQYQADLDFLPAGLNLEDLNDTGIYKVDLASLPDGLSFPPPEVAGSIRYDPDTQKLIASRIFLQQEREILRDASSDPDYLGAIETLFSLQDDPGLQGRISYDQDTKKLVFAGIMTRIRRNRLENASTEGSYRAAIEALFEAPRKFVTRHLRRFSIPSFSVELAKLPSTVQVPLSLRDKVYYDAVADPKQLHFRGVMTEDEYYLLLELSQDSAYQDVVKELFGKPDNENIEEGDKFITDADVSFMFDDPTTPDKRFLRVLEKLLPHLQQILSEGLVKQKIAENLKLEYGIADELLTHYVDSWAHSGNKSITAFVPAPPDFAAKDFAESNPNVKLTRDTFPVQFNTFILLHKIATIITGFEISKRELVWIFEHGLDVGWSDLNKLPIISGEDAASFQSWQRLSDLFRLRDRLPLGRLILDEIFRLARAGGTTIDEILKRLSESTRWGSTDLEGLVSALGFTVDKFRDEHALVRLLDCFSLIKGLKMSARQCLDLAKADVAQHVSRGVRQSIGARYAGDENGKGVDQWLSVAKPLRDLLREKQRAALVEYLVAHFKIPFPILEWPHPILRLESPWVSRPAVKEVERKLNAWGGLPVLLNVDGLFGPDTQNGVITFQQANGISADGVGVVGPETWSRLDTVRRNVRDKDDLYSHFLIDVEMSPCMVTSRIKLALSSIQLFVQRCMMNLEEIVEAGVSVDERWREWDWMKNYRVWEANRNVFLYPENWLEPELRIDKSPFFNELESQLLQGELTDEVVEEALEEYLMKVDQVARLEIMGIYRQIGDYTLGKTDVLHVIGRTLSEPYVHYYRQQEMESAHWTAWEKVGFDIEGNNLAPIFWNRRLYLFWPIIEVNTEGEWQNWHSKVKIAWIERQQNGWAAKKVSFTHPANLDFRPVWLRISCRIDVYNNLHIQILDPFVDTTNGQWKEKVAGFIFNEGNSIPVTEEYEQDLGYLPTNSRFGYNFFEEYIAEGDDALYLPAYADAKALTITPGAFYLLPPHDGSRLFDYPSFYMDYTRTFFISPLVPALERHWWRADEIDPSFISYIPASYYNQLKPFQLSKISPLLHEPQNAGMFRASSPVTPVRNNESSIMSPVVHKTTKTIVKNTGMKGDSDRIIPSNITRFTDDGIVMDGTEIPHQVFTELTLSDSAGLDTHPRLGESNSNVGRFPAYINFGLSEIMYRFETFYHPFTRAFVHELNRRGIDGLFERSIQIKPLNPIPILEWPHPILRLETPWVSRPAVKEVERKLNAWGGLPVPLNVDGLFGPDTQNGVITFQQANGISADGVGVVGPETWLLLDAIPSEPFNFSKIYAPTSIVNGPYPVEEVDFKYGNPYSIYNWELFFHIPLLIADRLSKNQQFEKAQKWFHRIFNPTDTSDDSIPQRYWQTRPFYETTREDYQKQRIQSLFKLLAVGNDPEKYDELSDEEKKLYNEFKSSIIEWRKNPFEPHLIALNRSISYQKTVVMKYIDNLIAWGDQLFRRETIESINEATQLYILAAEILGRRPEEAPIRATLQVQTYNGLESTLDEFSNALIQVEEFILPSGDESGPSDPSEHPTLVTLPSILYFCVPRNDKLLGYWDLVADRLFKIRHCMNIHGIVRQLPLFEPPIDPALLVRAAEAGIDISSVLNDINPALPNYRFSVLVQKASELCSELKSLGTALLTTLEKRDAEELSLIRAEHETSLLRLIELVKKQQLDEAEQNIVALSKSRDISQANYMYFGKLLGEDPLPPKLNEEIPERFHRLVTIPAGKPKLPTIPDRRLTRAELLATLGEEPYVEGEELVTKSLLDAADERLKASELEPVSSFFGSAPYFGPFLSDIAGLASGARFAEQHAVLFTTEADLYSKLVDRRLRAHEWNLKYNLAAREIMQIDKQIKAAEIRVEIAKQELSIHVKQIENARQLEDFMRSKYTNQELYSWMISQVTAIYFQSYQLAYDVAKRAETAYRFELGLSDSNFIVFGYWDSLKRGLLAGERLYHDIKRMEVAYLDQNQREYEITKHVSLSRLDPLALAQLKQTGECFVAVPEAIFDLDYPGHYLRRIEYASLTVPCVTGPYTGVNCTLTLLRSSVRHSNSLLGSPPRYRRLLEEEDPRFRDNSGAIQSIVTSSGQNDSGLFETNLRDERYLPFEGSGAISEWHIRLPKDFRQFDYDTISDVVLHLRYTARGGGEPLRNQAVTELNEALNEFLRTEGQNGLALPISLRHEFPSEWHRFLNPPQDSADKPTLAINLGSERFPFMFQGRPIFINKIEMFLKIRPKYAPSHNENTLKLTLEPEVNPSSNPDELGLSPWNGLLRAVKAPNSDLGGKLGNWILTAWRDTDPPRMDPNAVEDILVVCNYSL